MNLAEILRIRLQEIDAEIDRLRTKHEAAMAQLMAKKRDLGMTARRLTPDMDTLVDELKKLQVL